MKKKRKKKTTKDLLLSLVKLQDVQCQTTLFSPGQCGLEPLLLGPKPAAQNLTEVRQKTLLYLEVTQKIEKVVAKGDCVQLKQDYLVLD